MISEVDSRKLTELVREAMKDAPPFEPHAFFNPALDRIEVVVRDCSITEISKPHSYLVLFRDAHNNDCVGFGIECADSFCFSNDLVDQHENVSLAGVLDLIVRAFPRDREDCALAQGLITQYGLATVAMVA